MGGGEAGNEGEGDTADMSMIWIMRCIAAINVLS